MVSFFFAPLLIFVFSLLFISFPFFSTVHCNAMHSYISFYDDSETWILVKNEKSKGIINQSSLIVLCQYEVDFHNNKYFVEFTIHKNMKNVEKKKS